MVEKIKKLIDQCKTVKQLHQLHAHSTASGLLLLSSAKLLHILTNLLLSSSSSKPKPKPKTKTKTSSLSNSHLRYATSLFNSIPRPSTFCYNTLIRAHTLLSSPLPALLLFSQMRRLSLPLDSHSFPLALKASAQLRALPFAESLHCQAFKSGFLPDFHVLNSLISAYSVSGGLESARRVFDESPGRDVVSYNALIHGFVKVGALEKARELFDVMPERDSVSWGTLIAGYAQRDHCEEAIGLFERMVDLAVRPDNVALVSTLSACARRGELHKGRRIHDFIKRNGIRVDSFLLTALVDFYAKCGCIDIAMNIFDSSPDKGMFTWNAMLVGLAMHSHGRLLLNYFSRMINAGVEPDGITFLGVLVGCSHGGLVDEARRLFNEMECIYKVPRELKHYGCMADLLARAGLIEEAMEMIKRMPISGDVSVWSGLLGGCKIHGNVDIAEKAAKQVMELKPEDGGVYSILANVYANAERWDDVVKIRRLMSGNRVVKKNPAYSLIQLNGVLHEFVSGDSWHSRSNDIYLVLNGIREHQTEVQILSYE